MLLFNLRWSKADQCTGIFVRVNKYANMTLQPRRWRGHFDTFMTYCREKVFELSENRGKWISCHTTCEAAALQRGSRSAMGWHRAQPLVWEASSNPRAHRREATGIQAIGALGSYFIHYVACASNKPSLNQCTPHSFTTVLTARPVFSFNRAKVN